MSIECPVSKAGPEVMDSVQKGALQGFQQELFQPGCYSITQASDSKAEKPSDKGVRQKKIDAALDDCGKAMADILKIRGRLDMVSLAGNVMFSLMDRVYAAQGKEGIHKLIDIINRNLSPNYKLTIDDGPEILKESQHNDTNQPSNLDYVAKVKMQNAKGEIEGTGVLFINERKAKQKPSAPEGMNQA
jgi:hypothetical protein